jgi:hypothetical protein
MTLDHNALQVELTLDDLVPCRPPTAQNRASSENLSNGDAFTEFVSRENVQQRMNEWTPDPAVSAMRDRMVEDVVFNTRKSRPRRRNHLDNGEGIGDVVEYERFRRGETRDMRFWEKHERIERPHRGTVVIHADQSIKSDEDAESMKWTGAVCLALTDLLETVGYRVVVRSVVGTQGNERQIQSAVLLKAEDERLSDNAMAYLCTGGIYRILHFNWRCTLPIRINHGMGSSTRYEGDLKADITVPRTVRSEAAAVTFVEEAMREYTDTERFEEE